MPTKPTVYVLVEDHSPSTGETIPAGTTVFQYTWPDYGLAKHDTRLTGQRHISVTLDGAQGYPFFTIPVSKLREA